MKLEKIYEIYETYVILRKNVQNMEILEISLYRFIIYKYISIIYNIL